MRLRGVLMPLLCVAALLSSVPRYDAAATDAKLKAAEVASMCKAGKMAEAEKIAKATMTALGVKP